MLYAEHPTKITIDNSHGYHAAETNVVEVMKLTCLDAWMTAIMSSVCRKVNNRGVKVAPETTNLRSMYKEPFCMQRWKCVMHGLNTVAMVSKCHLKIWKADQGDGIYRQCLP